jgi:hypothetical protein
MLCPNKVLKNEKMVEVHLESKVSLCSQRAHMEGNRLIKPILGLPAS